MTRIPIAALCLLALAAGQRGSKRFTPSPFLQGQDIGFYLTLRTTSRPVTLNRGRRPAQLPPVIDNEVEDNRLNSPAISLRTSGLRSAAVSASQIVRAPLRSSNRRRRIQAVTVQVPTKEEVTDNPLTVGAAFTSTSSGVNTASTSSNSAIISSTEASGAVGTQRRQSGSTRTRSKTSRRRSHSRRRKVKKVRKLIHPGDEENPLVNDSKPSETASGTANEIEESVSIDNIIQTASPSPSATSVRSPVVIRRKKVFRGSSRRRPVGGRTINARRQFSGRRRIVAPATSATPRPQVETSTTSFTRISTSAQFEPFPVDDNELDNVRTSVTNSPSTTEESRFGFTKFPVGTEAPPTLQVFNTQTSNRINAVTGSEPSHNDIDSAGQLTSSEQTLAQRRRRPSSRGSSRANARGRGPVVSSVQQNADNAPLRPRGRGNGRRLTSGASSTSSTSRRQFSGRRRPTVSSPVPVAVPVSTTETSITTTTARPSIRRPTVQNFRPNIPAFNTAGQGTQPSSQQSTAAFRPTSSSFSTESATSTPFRAEGPPGRFSFGTGLTNNRSPVPPTSFATFSSSPSFAPTASTSAGSSLSEGGSGRKTFTFPTPRPVTVPSRPPAKQDFGPTASPRTPFFTNPTTTRGPGQSISSTRLFDFSTEEPVSNPAFGTFSFGTEIDNSNSITESSAPFSTFGPTTRPTQRPSGSNFLSFSPSPSQTIISGGSSLRSSSRGFRPSTGPGFTPSQANSNSVISSSSQGSTSFRSGQREPTNSVSSTRFPGSSSSVATSLKVFSPAPALNTGRQPGANVRLRPSGFSPSTSFRGGFRPLNLSAEPTAAPHPSFSTEFSFPSVFAPDAADTSAPSVPKQNVRDSGSDTQPASLNRFKSTSPSFRGGPVQLGNQRGFVQFGTSATRPGVGDNSIIITQRPLQREPATFTPLIPKPSAPPQTVGSTSRRRVTQSSTTLFPTTRSPSRRVTQPPATALRGSTTSRRVTQPPTTAPRQEVSTFIGNTIQQPSSAGVKTQQRQGGRALAGFQSVGSSVNSLIPSGQNQLLTGNPVRTLSSSGKEFQHGFRFSQAGGLVSLGSHLAGFQSRVPTFREDVVINDPLFSSKDIKPGFTCEGKPYGYYADVANECRIFHICQPVGVSGLHVLYTRYSFFCGKQTRFDQSKLSCLHTEDAIPCGESENWLFRNDDFGLEKKTETFQVDVTPAS